MIPNRPTGQHIAVAACLDQLVAAVEWDGDRSALLRAMPHERADLDTQDLRNVLAEIGWGTEPVSSDFAKLNTSMLPVIIQTVRGNLISLLDSSGPNVRGFDPRIGVVMLPSRVEALPTGRSWALAPLSGWGTDHSTPSGDAWWREFVLRFSGEYRALVGIAILTIATALVVPVYTALVFDTVIPANSAVQLGLLVGAAIALIAVDFAIGLTRTALHARLTARVGRLISTAVFRQLLDLPPLSLESARIRQQLGKLRQLDQARDVFGEAVLGVAVNALSSVLLLGLLLLFVGWAAVLPLIAMAAVACVATLSLRALDRAAARAAATREARDGMADELVREAVPLRLAGAGELWRQRIAAAGARSSEASQTAVSSQRRLQIFGATVTQAAGYGTLFLLATDVMSGAISGGALMAGAYLVWKLLTPWQAFLSQLPRFVRLRKELSTLDNFMQIPSEAQHRPGSPFVRRQIGTLAFDNVGLSYAPGYPPALLGVTITARPGQMLGIQGASGAGKSTLLKAALGMVQPQVGRVLLDGTDIRQMNPRELRRQFAYLPQRTVMYSGTIEQNITLASPEATRYDIEKACDAAGLLSEIDLLPSGLGTRLRDLATDTLSPGFAQRICLARTYLVRAPIVLLDEPGKSLDEAADALFRAWVDREHGHRTMVVVTHRPSHLRYADDVIWLEGGRIAEAAPAPIGTERRSARPVTSQTSDASAGT